MKMIAAPFAIIAAAAALASAAPAFAESVAVEYKDLDLATQEGRAMLDRRLDAAARQVCGLDEVRTGTRIRSHAARQCYKDAKSQLAERIAAVVEKQARGG